VKAIKRGDWLGLVICDDFKKIKFEDKKNVWSSLVTEQLNIK
jgi:hypothetical protein